MRGLLVASIYDHRVDQLELIETHISWVVLTGPYAYKIKKPVDLGFLDFSTLEKRHHYALEEVRLNQRLAGSLYIGVVPITGSRQHPRLDGDGTVIDYAVKMEQFPQEAQLDRMLDSGVLEQTHLDAFVDVVAQFHTGTLVADPNSRYGMPDAVYAPVAENFRHIRECASVAASLPRLADLECWSKETRQNLSGLFEERKRQGFIRECHGDLHLRNLAWIEGKPVAFDCIEFSDDLRWIDVLSDVSFLVMDDLLSRVSVGSSAARAPQARLASCRTLEGAECGGYPR